MSSLNVHKRGKYYLRGLLLDVSDSPINALRRTEPSHVSNLGEGSDRCYQLQCRSSIRPADYLVERFQCPESEDHYIHHLFGLDVSITDNDTAFFLLAPNKEILEITRPVSSTFDYVKCNLLKICSDQFRSSCHGHVKVTRLNARLIGDLGNAISSVAFYGNDIIPSQVIKEILGINNDIAFDEKYDPFSSAENRLEKTDWLKQIRFIDPKSIRLIWDDGKTKPASLNIDIFGNFSLYCRDDMTLSGVAKIFEYLKSIDAFIKNVTIDPLKRSSRALEIINT